jgi:hypothetical protein
MGSSRAGGSSSSPGGDIEIGNITRARNTPEILVRRLAFMTGKQNPGSGRIPEPIPFGKQVQTREPHDRTIEAASSQHFRRPLLARGLDHRGALARPDSPRAKRPEYRLYGVREHVGVRTGFRGYGAGQGRT